MPLLLVTPPAAEPVSLANAKLHLGVDFPDNDALIASFISAAREYAESYTLRQFVTAQWRYILDRFPCQIILPKSSCQQVISIQYIDMSGATQTVPSTDYIVDAASDPARIAPGFGKIWPISLPQICSVWVTFDAGYGVAESVPEGIKNWIRSRVGSLYEHRKEVETMKRGSIGLLPYMDHLLDPYRVVLA